LIKRFIDEGGFGKVFEGENLENHERVAIKCIDLGVTGTEAYNQRKKRLQNELTVGVQFESPHLVRLLSYHLETTYCYLIMEFCSGGDLEKVLNEKKKLPKDVC
jgi:serine/threonine-protein kinase